MANFSICSLLSEESGNSEELKSLPVTSSNLAESQTFEQISSSDAPASSKKSLDDKPIYSYAALIVMAIRNSPQKRLTLNNICTWIADNFSYYQNNKSDWQNSVRHCLSLNSFFVKIPRALDDPGRGHYWVLDYSAQDIIVGETTGRLRRKNYMTGSAVEFRRSPFNYGVANNHPYRQNMPPGMAYVDPYNPNAVYMPTPEEIEMVQRIRYLQNQHQAARANLINYQHMYHFN